MRLHSDYSPASFPGLLASVPSCVEDLSTPVAEPSSSQAGSSSSAGEYSWPPGACAYPKGTAELPPLQSQGAEDGDQNTYGPVELELPPGTQMVKEPCRIMSDTKCFAGKSSQMTC